MSWNWRKQAAPIIAGVLEATAGQTEREIRKALTAAYPFGERRYWPYKVWLSEVRRQRFGGRQRQGSERMAGLEIAGQETFGFNGPFLSPDLELSAARIAELEITVSDEQFAWLEARGLLDNGKTLAENGWTE